MPPGPIHETSTRLIHVSTPIIQKGFPMRFPDCARVSVGGDHPSVNLAEVRYDRDASLRRARELHQGCRRLAQADALADEIARRDSSGQDHPEHRGVPMGLHPMTASELELIGDDPIDR
jgi:hypothetical protein